MRDAASPSRSVRFSKRTDWDTHKTDWSRALDSRRRAGLPVYDLTSANPAQSGFHYDGALLEALLQPAALRYEPDPKGLLAAREAVCAYYRAHCAALPETTQTSLTPDQVLLTASTSEAYSFLFRLLCDPGDEILIAQPSYPLFDFLAVLDDVKLVPYPLFYDYGWHLDTHALRQSIGPRTRAIVVVHPNNPTGHFTRQAERRALETLCAEFGLALIVDEVFLDYGLARPEPGFVCGEHPVLTFVLSGLSKIAGLPQMKLAWIATLGPAQLRQAALQRLEVVADTFLSVSAPLQLALPEWLRNRDAIQRQIKARVAANLAALDSLLAHSPAVRRLQVEGGWYAIVRVPALSEGEAAALLLLREEGVAIHPGSYFGMAGDGCFILSLLPEETVFLQGAARLVERYALARNESPAADMGWPHARLP